MIRSSRDGSRNERRCLGRIGLFVQAACLGGSIPWVVAGGCGRCRFEVERRGGGGRTEKSRGNSVAAMCGVGESPLNNTRQTRL